MTIIYLIRHSKPLKVNNSFNNDNLQTQNEKQILSIEGEQIAKEKLNNKEFNNIDIIFSSNYVRTIQTAKYLSEKNNLEINVISDLAERKHGVNSWSKLPFDFEIKQYKDENYKISGGESRKETTDRIYSFINKLLNEYKNKKILIVGHSTAFMFLLMKWCDITYEGDYRFNGVKFFDGKWNYCETFKLEFDDYNKLINITNIEL